MHATDFFLLYMQVYYTDIKSDSYSQFAMPDVGLVSVGSLKVGVA